MIKGLLGNQVLVTVLHRASELEHNLFPQPRLDLADNDPKRPRVPPWGILSQTIISFSYHRNPAHK